MTPRWPIRGDAAPAALWAAGIMTGIAFLMAGIIGSGRAYMRERALVDEANNFINAVRAYQADHAAPLSEYNDAAEVGWPGTTRADPGATPPVLLDTDCADALNILAGGADPSDPNYISTAYQASPQSLVFPSLRWVTSCAGASGEQFRLQLTSFGEAEICSANPEGQSGPCPLLPVAQNLAGATGGAVLPENPGGPGENFDLAQLNFYVNWTVWRGAAYPALNRLSEMLLWKNYTVGRSFDLDQPTTALSGIRLGGWEDPPGSGTFYDSGTPPELARFIVGAADSVRTTEISPLQTPTTTNIDGRSFAMFYRAARHDPFDTTAPNPLFQMASGPCIAGTPPTWLSMVETIRLSFPGFDNTDQATITLRSTPDRITLIPTSWQVHDTGGALAYNPDVQVDFLTVLPGFFRDRGLSTENYCHPAVVHGHVDSVDINDPLAVFERPSGQVLRDCNYTDGSGPVSPPFTQTLPDLPRADISVHGGQPAVELSAVGYCPMPGAPGDV